MKVLMLSPVHPCPPDRGSKIRIYHCVRRVNRHHRVHGLAFSDPDSQGKIAGRAGSTVCTTVETVGRPRRRLSAAVWSLALQVPYRSAKFQDPVFRERLREVVVSENFDVVWVHFLNMLPFLHDPVVRKELEGATVVLDQHNDMERFWAPNQNHGSVFKRVWARWNIDQIRRLREKILALCDVILSVSEKDAHGTRRVAPSDVPVWVVPNGVDPDQFEFRNQPSPDSTSDRILFVGSMDVEMNVDAVTWFVKDIFPKIRNRIPGVIFDIVGRDPTSAVQALEKEEGVRVTGRVDDLQPYYDRATVAVVPSRLGGGTKLKVPEAMASGVPVVATSTGAQGLDVEDGEHILIADQKSTFADSVVRLLRNPDEASRLVQAARTRVEEKYSWAGIYDRVIERIEKQMTPVG